MNSHVFSALIEAIGLVIILSACSIDRKISYREIIAMRTHNQFFDLVFYLFLPFVITIWAFPPNRLAGPLTE